MILNFTCDRQWLCTPCIEFCRVTRPDKGEAYTVTLQRLGF